MKSGARWSEKMLERIALDGENVEGGCVKSEKWKALE